MKSHFAANKRGLSLTLKNRQQGHRRQQCTCSWRLPKRDKSMLLHRKQGRK